MAKSQLKLEPPFTVLDAARIASMWPGLCHGAHDLNAIAHISGVQVFFLRVA